MTLASVAAWAQMPSQDARLIDPPGTNTHFRMPAYRTLAEWEARKAQLRKQILSAAGLLPMPERTPLHPQVFGRIEKKDYSVEKVLLETMPGYWLGGNLYRPPSKPGRFPAVASPHGHWAYGRLENTSIASIPARCINLARQGYVVFSYDMVGYDDTLQTSHKFGGPREQLWAFSPLGLQLWNSTRVVDFLESLPEVDRERIAATGASGGATQVFLLAAVDERVRVSAPVNMLSFQMQGGCECEGAPNLRLGVCNVEYGAMTAPRPMLMVSDTGDWTRETPREEFPAVQSIYRLYGKPGNVENVHIDAPHNYNLASREAVYRFFARHVLGAAGAEDYAEKPFSIEPLPDLLALHNRTLPAGALTYQQILEQWIAAAKRQNDAAVDRARLRERLSLALGSRWPARVLSETAGERVVLSREGVGDRIPGIRIAGHGPVTLVVGPEGAEAARQSLQVRQMLREGGAVMLIDAFETGAARAKRDTSARGFLTFNQTDDANRVQDILTALAYLGQERTRLVGIGAAGVWCVFAAAVAERDVTVKADLSGFAGQDRDYLERFFVPGIQRAGGLEAALKLVRVER